MGLKARADGCRSGCWTDRLTDWLAPSTYPHASEHTVIAAIELATLDKTFSADKPWELGFVSLGLIYNPWATLECRDSLDGLSPHPPTQDPLNFSKGKSAEQMKDLELKEIKNGRLAMVAMIGAWPLWASFCLALGSGADRLSAPPSLAHWMLLGTV